MHTLIAITAEGEGWLELELLHRRWWWRDRREIIRVVGITRVSR